jgi:hypothetical protein
LKRKIPVAAHTISAVYSWRKLQPPLNVARRETAAGRKRASLCVRAELVAELVALRNYILADVRWNFDGRWILHYDLFDSSGRYLLLRFRNATRPFPFVPDFKQGPDIDGVQT